MVDIVELKSCDGIYSIQGEPGVDFGTKNLIPGVSVYGERLFLKDEVEYREWMHSKSKLASGMKRGIRIPELKSGISVLYLGASAGTTVSHISDIVGPKGRIFAVEFSPKMARDLLKLSSFRSNIIPIIADARYPSEYTHLVDVVDFLYCDVSQPNQSELFVNNAHAFLKSNGIGYIAIKSRSISQRQKADEIFKNQVQILETGGFEKIKTANIARFHKEHSVFLGRWN